MSVIVSVTVCSVIVALDELTVTLVVPLPERVTLAVVALDEIEIDADFASPVCGENTISNVQLLDAANE